MTNEDAINILKDLKESAELVVEYADRAQLDTGYVSASQSLIKNILCKLANLEIDDEEEVNDEDMLPDNCLYLKGYITHDGYYHPAVCPNKDFHYSYDTDSIIKRIENYADSNGFLREKQTGLGGRQSYIRSCNMKAFFSKKECSLVEAHRKFDAMVYGGDLATDTSYTGYSEWTITGLDLDEFTIGGHDLKREFESHMGEYVHLIIECN